MPKLTIALWVFYLFVSLGVRMLIQLRTTGHTGFVLARNNANRLQVIASTIFVGSALAGLLSPILALAFPEHPLWRPFAVTPALTALGLIGYLAGVSLAFAAQLTLGKSWRVGVDRDERTELIMRGVFRVVRNPIFSALQLTAVGLAFLCSTPLAWLACATQFVALEMQVRGVEEPYLARMHGAEYRQYLSQVGRFVPGIGLRQRMPSRSA